MTVQKASPNTAPIVDTLAAAPPSLPSLSISSARRDKRGLGFDGMFDKDTCTVSRISAAIVCTSTAALPANNAPSMAAVPRPFKGDPIVKVVPHGSGVSTRPSTPVLSATTPYAIPSATGVLPPAPHAQGIRPLSQQPVDLEAYSGDNAKKLRAAGLSVGEIVVDNNATTGPAAAKAEFRARLFTQGKLAQLPEAEKDRLSERLAQLLYHASGDPHQDKRVVIIPTEAAIAILCRAGLEAAAQDPHSGISAASVEHDADQIVQTMHGMRADQGMSSRQIRREDQRTAKTASRSGICVGGTRHFSPPPPPRALVQSTDSDDLLTSESRSTIVAAPSASTEHQHDVRRDNAALSLRSPGAAVRAAYVEQDRMRDMNKNIEKRNIGVRSLANAESIAMASAEHDSAGGKVVPSARAYLLRSRTA